MLTVVIIADPTIECCSCRDDDLLVPAPTTIAAAAPVNTAPVNTKGISIHQ